MPLIPEDILDDVQRRADIGEVIGRYVPLARAGRHLKARCPFHQERTPSFMVNTEKQIFHCFGCGVGGNIFSFLMQHDRLSFPEAVRQLAAQVGVRIPDRPTAAADGAAVELSALMEKTCRYFERALADPATGEAARAYLCRRGVAASSWRAYRLGAAPPGWRRLLETATAAGIRPERLEAAGLVVKSQTGTYDRFRHRLIFPITEVTGRVVGFGGRSLDEQEPKYLNSPETALYSKGRHLFGLTQAKAAILQVRTAVVVEGYFDCVVLAEAGLSHVVSPLGTALTSEQARLLRRYADRVVLAFDPDAAGEQATLRGIDRLVELGLEVRVARLPAGVDPDDYVRTAGRAALEEALTHSDGILDVLLESALRRFPGTDAEERVRAAQFALPTIARVPDAMLRSEYAQRLADRLRLDPEAVLTELAKAQPRAVGTPAAALGSLAGAHPGAPHGPERLLAALVLEHPDRWRGVQQQLGVTEVTDPALQQVLATVSELDAHGARVTPAAVISRLAAAQADQEGGVEVEPTDPAALVAELVALAQQTEAKDAAFDECLARLRAGAQRRELAELRDQLRAAQDAGHETELARLMTVYQERLSTASR
jgi:DNA primase